MKVKNIIVKTVMILLQLCSSLLALPTTEREAEMVVTGWLKADSQPFGMTLGQQVMGIESFTDDYGEPVYYIVYLQPSGFVIVSADDLVEPIIGFANSSTYDPSLENPLGALVTNDLKGRIAAVRYTFGPLANTGDATVADSQRKWSYLLSLAEASDDGLRLMGLTSISDVHVAPLVRARWSQSNCCTGPNIACYNYYTPQWVWDDIDQVQGHIQWKDGDPDNYPCGCVATAMAQLMWYHKYPEEGIGINEHEIKVRYGENEDEVQVTQAYTRGGDGKGGPYEWHLMVPEPYCNTNLNERKAIGALCYDAGISANMTYSDSGSGASMFDAKEELIRTFSYSNAIYGYGGGINLGPWLVEMINPNLDAQKPVIFSILRPPSGGHAIVCDGYGYNFSTPYHHLNMGWGSSKDAWYNLPNIDTSEQRMYDTIRSCTYNIYKSGQGEIISGRVLRTNGEPAEGASVYMLPDGSEDPYEVLTNSNGIYFFDKLDPNTLYTIWASVDGYVFPSREVATRTSKDDSPISGNRWGIDFPWSTQQKIIYVDCDVSTGNNDGSNWNNAFIDLQDAIEVAANSGSEINEIWVAEGTYKPDRGTGLRTLSFQLLNGVGIYGGFDGDETERGHRNPEINRTILSGDLNGDDGENLINNEENSYHVVNGSGTDDTAVIDGFTIAGGNASGAGLAYGYGAGMFIYSGSPTVNHCTFINNDANGYGGGMCNSYSNPIVTNCTFTENSAAYGGGMYNRSNSSPTLTGCTFVGNSAANGGGMRNYRSSPTLEKCTFSKNSAENSGGGMYNSYSNPILTNCTLTENSATEWGGSIFNYNSNPTLTNSTFSENSAQWGGGISNYYSSPTLINCDFINNEAIVINNQYNSLGGGIDNDESNPILTNCTFTKNSAAYGGGMYNYNNSSPILTDCTFRDNPAQSGGGIRNFESSPTLENCTFNGNSAEIYGGGIYNSFSNSTLTDCIFTENSAEWGGGFHSYQSNLTVTNCTFAENHSQLGGGAVNNAENSCNLQGCTFLNNLASDDGGAIRDYDCNSHCVNCLFVGNRAMDNGGAVHNGSGNDYTGQLTHLINCTFNANNAEDYGGAICDWSGGTTAVSNCILWANTDQRGSTATSQINATNDPLVSYSCVQSTDRDPWPGEGNIKSDPLFANPANGDFHLKSQAGRWDPFSESWVIDEVTSPCIDAGDPTNSIGLEPLPNGGRINMGAYGGTSEASKSP